MAKLVLKFEESVLKEIPMSGNEVSIGRSPDNGIVIDNPAVSHYHARVFNEEGRLTLQDFGSLNGTFVNGQRVNRTTLKPGDQVMVGKHTIVVSESREPEGLGEWTGGPRTVAPKINETVVLGTKERRNFIQQVAAAGETSQVAPARVKLATLVVQGGSAVQKEYTLTDKLTVIGSSKMATVRLNGWFKPKAAAQINRRDDGSYYLGAADRVPTVNGQPITHPVKLSSGDVIAVAGIELQFLYRD